MDQVINNFLEEVKRRNAHEPEFMQAVTEVAQTVLPYIVTQEIYHGKNILMRMVEPERVVMFRVPWIDDQGEIQVNRGYRIEMNSAIGPYKGGLRFHESVNLSILKFLAFEQVFKNALTTLPMGGGKGVQTLIKRQVGWRGNAFLSKFYDRAISAYWPKPRYSCWRHWRWWQRNRVYVWAIQAIKKRIYRRLNRERNFLGRVTNSA